MRELSKILHLKEKKEEKKDNNNINNNRTVSSKFPPGMHLDRASRVPVLPSQTMWPLSSNNNYFIPIILLIRPRSEIICFHQKPVFVRMQLQTKTTHCSTD